MKFKNIPLVIFISLLIFSESIEDISLKSGLRKEDFEKEIDGKKTQLFVLTNKNGIEISITNYGGALCALMVPDKDGKFENIVQTHDSIDHIINSPNPYLSSLIGRYGNRIKDAKFKLDGKEYKLSKNDGYNHLHGGPTGFHSRIWDAEQINDHELKLKYVSEDMEEGYPGKLTMEVTFSLNDKNEFKISYRGKTDKKTIVNMTYHMYVNLLGITDPCPGIENHILTLNADNFIPTDYSQIPTGEITSVKVGPFNFLKPKTIGEGLEYVDNPQIEIGKGFDHCFCLNKKYYGELSYVGKLFEPSTKRYMEMYTTEPGVLMYTANFHSGFKGYHGARLIRRSGVAFEMQHFPNSPNMGFFPSVILKPGDTYVQDTIYKFGIEK